MLLKLVRKAVDTFSEEEHPLTVGNVYRGEWVTHYIKLPSDVFINDGDNVFHGGLELF